MSRSTRVRMSRGTSFSLSSYFATTLRPERVAQLVRRPSRRCRARSSSSSANSCVSSRPSAGEVPVVVVDVLADELLDLVVEELLGGGQQVAAHVRDFFFAEVNLALEDLAAQRVDALTLLVHHVVVFEQVLADGEVLRFDLLLRALDGARRPCRARSARLLPCRAAASGRRCDPSRRCASGRLRATGRSATSPDRPGGRRGRAAGCRCGALRAARCR